jgi:prevent-host-death family protein
MSEVTIDTKQRQGDRNMLTVGMKDARGELAELLNKVAYAHERVAITRHRKNVAYLVSEEDMKLIRFIEDKIDKAAALEAMKEGGENVAFDDLMKEAGL